MVKGAYIIGTIIFFIVLIVICIFAFSNSNKIIVKSDCGSVSEDYIKSLANSASAEKNDVVTCMSLNIRDCKASRFNIDGDNKTIFSIESSSSGEICTLKNQIINGKTTECNFTKSILKEYYLGTESKLKKGWMISVALSSSLERTSRNIDLTKELGENYTRQISFGFTNPSTGNSELVPCRVY